ncbi:MAG TPA: hypothetical protein P5268_01915 [Candidatus Marinimicrobia bacterium]|nr:hypothetical protein [Candidatus Neomarinimicrobiota bacterium]HRS50887.1 hypothetical protein [Candidatus Neomarinimicrobiota bacterium]HRU91771.1 hypothetical protein [Candidatus Neomarinimicrobiota bacterium]
MRKTLVRVIVLALLMLTTIMAQDFSMDQIKELAETNGKLYLQPLATGFGTAMNSGLYNTAGTHHTLGFDIQLKTGFGLAPASKASQTTYQFDLSALDDITFNIEKNSQSYAITLNPEEIFLDCTTPNILGGKAEPFTVNEPYVQEAIESQLRTQLQAQGLTEAQINEAIAQLNPEINDAIDGIQISSIPGMKSIKALKDLKTVPFPFPILQASVGLPMGIEPSIRIIPKFKIPGDIGEAIGEISAFGGGLKLDVDRWIPIPMFPLDIAVQGYYQKMEIGDLLSANSTAFNLMVSKTILMLTPYIGVGKESSKFTASYTMEDGTKIKFDLEGKDDMRYTAGLNIKIAVLSINAEYSMGEYNAAGIGVGFAFR